MLSDPNNSDDLNKLKIVLISVDDKLFKQLRLILQKEHMTTSWMLSVDQALRLKPQPQLAFIDDSGLDGASLDSVMQRMWDQFPNIRIVYVIPSNHRTAGRNLQHSGVADYVVKPLDGIEIMQTIQQVADRQHEMQGQAVCEQAELKQEPQEEEAVREQALCEQVQRDKELREQALREQVQREQELREQALREQVQRDKELREQALREQVQREQAQREQELREQVQREQAQREQELREQLQREQAQREQELREQVQREQTQREQELREQEQREQAQYEQELREQAQREQEQRERARQEQAQREQELREQAQRERARQEQAQREQELREQAQREQAQRERVRQEQAQREQELREQAQREQEQYERARQEQAQQEQLKYASSARYTPPAQSSTRQTLTKQASPDNMQQKSNLHKQQVETKVITLFSTIAGTGKTTLAINLAAALAKRASGKLCIVDADLQFGDVARYLHYSAAHTVADYAENFCKGRPVTDYLCRWSDQVHILTAPDSIKRSEHISPLILSEAVKELEHNYEYIIIDTATGFGESTINMLDLSTAIVFVGTVEHIPSIKKLRVGLEVLRSLGQESKINLLLNRDNSQKMLDLRQVKDALGASFQTKIVNDYEAVVRFVKTGIPFVQEQPGKLVSKQVCQLAETFLHPSVKEGEKDLEKQGGLFHKLADWF